MKKIIFLGIVIGLLNGCVQPNLDNNKSNFIIVDFINIVKKELPVGKSAIYIKDNNNYNKELISSLRHGGYAIENNASAAATEIRVQIVSVSEPKNYAFVYSFNNITYSRAYHLDTTTAPITNWTKVVRNER